MSWSKSKIIYRLFGLKTYKSTIFRGSFGNQETDILVSAQRFISASSPLYVEKKDTSKPLSQTPDPKQVESGWYEWWESQGYFKPKPQINDDNAKFVMCLPPPNITGSLHLGHALTNSIQDAIVRWHRMNGRQTLWVPGCDHAGIATQVIVEKKLWKEQKKTRHDLGREEFLKEVWKWKNEKGGEIFQQMRKLGSSLDWSKEAFTLDPHLSKAVTEAFVRLHDQGLIYRSNRLVNWSCSLKSAISDIEVDNIELEGKTKLKVPGYNSKLEFGTLTHFAYPVDTSSEEIVVATTRLETMLGDTAVAVHPDDNRYKHLHGTHVRHPFLDKLLPVVCDSQIDMAFGTGAVKITPAHDSNDFDLGKRHALPSINILDDDGKMNKNCGEFSDMKRFEARYRVANALKELGLLKEIRSHPMSLPVCSRSGDIIEPRLKPQWYIDCDNMAKNAVEAVETKELKLYPEFYEKVWNEWLKNIKDWCISRQLWWGHRVPAYRICKTPQDDDEVVWIAGRDINEALEKASKLTGLAPDEITLQQDEDVLDTWFSSALFPFSVFGWPQQTPDLQRFYPTDLLETGRDILFFWVARMVMLGQHLTGKLPFKQVLLHCILRDAHGRKMSKSLGNVIDPMHVIQGATLQTLNSSIKNSNLDPEEVAIAIKGQQIDFPKGIPECGADVLRFTLCSYNFKSDFINMNVTHAESYKRFNNKIWQAFRYVTNNLGLEFQPNDKFQLTGNESSMDLWVLSRLSNLVHVAEACFNTYDLHLVTRAIYLFWWTDFCDIYLEYTKSTFLSEDPVEIATKRKILYHCVQTCLCVLHPFMPFITEELFQRLPRQSSTTDSICIMPYPIPEEFMLSNAKVESEVEDVRAIMNTIMSIRKDFNVSWKLSPNVTLTCSQSSGDLDEYRGFIQQFTKCQLNNNDSVNEGCVTRECGKYKIHVQLKGMVQTSDLIHSITQKLDKLQLKVVKLTEQNDKRKKKSRLDTEEANLQYQEKVNDIKTQMASLNSILEQTRQMEDN